MSYVWLTWLADALRKEGCRVVEYDGWKSRGRPSSTGAFNPYALLLHHTGTKTSMSNPAPTLSTCVHGRSDLPGPLCQVLIGYDGTCHVIAAGRANHAGECNGNGPTSSGDGNAQMVGFEIDYSGSQAVSDEQADAVGRAATAVLRRFKRDESYCRGHKETSTTGKWDPGRYGAGNPAYDMGEVRQRIKARLAGNPESEEEVAGYVSISSEQAQTLSPGATAVVAFQHEQSDTCGGHSESDWVSAIRPPEGFRVADFQLRCQLRDGNPGDRVRALVVGTPVDGGESSANGYQDFLLGPDGSLILLARHIQGANHDTRYRWQLQSFSSKALEIVQGGAFRALLYQT